MCGFIRLRLYLLKMKHTRFKIKPFTTHSKAQNYDEQQEIIMNENANKDPFADKPKIEDVILEMHKLLQNQESKHRGPGLSYFEARDRHILVETDRLSEGKYISDEIQAWIGQVCRDVMSSAFHYYLSEEMNYDQTKVYCCQGILKNISQFIERNRDVITPEFFKVVDEILKTKVLPYLGLKYPPSVTSDVNKRLNKVFKEINNMEVITNDFFYNTEITFEYRQNGIYNDLIMRVINQIIQIADSSAYQNQDAETKTQFEDFQQFMSDMFEKVYDQQWMIKGKKKKIMTENMNLSDVNQNKGQKEEEEKEKYKEQVKQYTHYLIGRKISENVQQFDEFQIKNGFVKIKSPTILRLLTKWCQQLWEKFEKQNYYIDRTEGMQMLKGKQINIVYPALKKILKLQMKAEKEKIEEYMKNIYLNNYDQQYETMENQQISKQAPFMNKHERICGKFSLKIVKNLESYIIIYLNRLIHGLMNVSKETYSRMGVMPSWPHPPNLLSFKVGDLLRCKCASKEREILRIFQELQDLSQKQPEKLRIIRIKNRLKLGTNDILMNVRFNNCLTAEIQLKAQSKTAQSQFSLCSYNFSHLIYEIERSYFGPISQMCGIWINLDPRVNIFRKFVSDQIPKKQITVLQDSYCFRNSEEHTFSMIQNKSFICSQCSKSYSNSNYAVPHSACSKCRYWKCALCSIKERQNSDLIDQVIQDQDIRKNCQRIRCKQLPICSVGLLIQSQIKQISYFKVIDAFQKKYLFKIINNQSFELFKQLATKKQINQFLEEYLIFKLNKSYVDNKLPNIDNSAAVKQYILPSYMRKCYKDEKQTISLHSLEAFNIKHQDFTQILEGNKQQKKRIKFIQLASNKLQSIEFITPDFRNLQLLNINSNRVYNIKHLASFNRLQILFAINNQISEIPAEICTLQLKYISLLNNNIKILPPEFCNLKQLQILKIHQNQLTQFPQRFSELQSLKQLYARNNKIASIKNLFCIKLEHLELNNNLLTVLPDQIDKLTNLIFLNLHNNKITSIQAQFSKMPKFKDLVISSNILEQIPIKLYGAPQLSKLIINNNRISKFDLKDCQFPMLKEVNFQNNLISEINDVKCLKNVVTLNLNGNKLQKLPQNIIDFVNLKTLNVTNNSLTQLPARFGQLKKLRELDIKYNMLSDFPPSFFELKLQILNFNKNKFTVLPSQLTNMKTLKELYFEFNKIQELPANITALSNLQTLSLNQNPMKIISLQTTQFKKLKIFNFNLISIQNLPVFVMNLTGYLNNHKIKTLPQHIPRIERIDNINLSTNDLTAIPASISNIINLKYLQINLNQLTQLCDAIFDLSNLSQLSVTHNQISILPDKFHRLTKLQTLYVNNNKIQYLPKSLENNLKNGLQLRFFSNPISYVPQWVMQNSKQWKKTTTFQISHLTLKQFPLIQTPLQYNKVAAYYNNLQIFPQTLLSCKNITYLNLSNNMIQDIPPLFNLQNLTQLFLDNNKIEEIPDSIGSLKPLTYLSITRNPIKILPSTLKNLKLNLLSLDLACFEDLQKSNSLQWINTKRLTFSQTNIQKLPEAFGSIGYLQEFILENHSSFKELPQSFVKLQSLKKVIIRSKSFSVLPEDIGKLQNLQLFNLTYGELSVLPQSFTQLKKLKFLSIVETKLQQLPDQIGNCENLIQISVRTNKLTKLPSSLGQLKLLELLSFRVNSITDFPPQICNCLKLKKLLAQFNLIKVIPKELQNLNSIQVENLQLEGNPIQQIGCLEYVLEKGDKATKIIADKIKENKGNNKEGNQKE